MSPLSGDASDDEVEIARPRRSRVGRYSVYGGVARNPDHLEPQPRLRRRPRSPADVAQSTLFEELLVAEIDDLEERAAKAEARWQRRCDRSPDKVVILPTELTELRQRMAEARRMLDALRARFSSD